MQYAAVEFARNVAGISAAAHAETAPGGSSLVVERLACSLEGQERLVRCVPGTRIHRLCGGAPFAGFHWCNYGVSNAYVERLRAHGLVVSATAEDAGVGAIELPTHPFFLATLFQPQVRATGGPPVHPIVRGFAESLICGKPLIAPLSGARRAFISASSRRRPQGSRSPRRHFGLQEHLQKVH
jgi:CTP synthase (UTP-ammonia lyase)